MKVKFTVTLEVDAKGWAEEYHLSTGEVRRDVQQYLEDQIRYSSQHGHLFVFAHEVPTTEVSA